MQSLFFSCMKERDKRGSARRVALFPKDRFHSRDQFLDLFTFASHNVTFSSSTSNEEGVTKGVIERER